MWSTHAFGGTGMLRLLLFALLMCIPVSSHAATYWDVEFVAGDFGTASQSQFGPLPSAMTIDTGTVFSGASSLKYTYGPECYQNLNSACGGSATRYFPVTNEHYGRFWIRLSSDYAVGVNNHSKMFGVRSQTGFSKIWFDFNGGTNLIVQAENTPTDGRTQNYQLNISITRGVWTCVEWRMRENTGGLSNGILQAWKDGIETVNYTDRPWRPAGELMAWNFILLYRQSGVGAVYLDRMAVGSTRIGCSGTTPPQDTTNPNPPTNFAAQ